MRNASHRLRRLNSWPPVGDAVWGSLGGIASLEEAWRWSWVWHEKLLATSSLYSVSCSWKRRKVSASGLYSQTCWLLPCLPTTTDSYPSGTVSINNPFFFYVALGSVLSHQQKAINISGSGFGRLIPGTRVRQLILSFGNLVLTAKLIIFLTLLEPKSLQLSWFFSIKLYSHFVD